MTKDKADFINQLRKNRPFPAFSNSSANPNIDLYDEFGNIVNAGHLRGAINRYFRWDGAATVEDSDHVAIPIRILVTQEGSASTDPDFPVLGNEYFGPTPITTDVTVRRLTQFQLMPNEAVDWAYGTQSGQTTANPDGSVTIRNLAINNQYQTLTINRATTVIVIPPQPGVNPEVTLNTSAPNDADIASTELYIDNVLVETTVNGNLTFSFQPNGKNIVIRVESFD